MNNSSCFCGSTQPFTSCCQPFLNGNKTPETAEQLMRSRYCAFVTENKDYLLSSWHPNHRPSVIDFSQATKWLGLKIKQTSAGLIKDSQGWVGFVARYKEHGRAHRIEELSYFVKEDGKWFYVSGDHAPPKT